MGATLASAQVDEGMWTFDNLPLHQLKEYYGFAPTAEWTEHLQKSSVRFNDGGSGAFVSKQGLVLTNHHVALGQLQKMSSPGKDYVKDGFFARSIAEEIKCPDLELNVLMSMDNVSEQIFKAINPRSGDKEQNEQRKAEIARITKTSAEQTGLRCDVIELYQGGEYWLYRYKKYTDVRLVMAPELQAAFFGGDPDNFTYPRYALDFAFFRAYENDKPVFVEHFLKWSQDGAGNGELVFVTGHPGHTDRLLTVAQLESEKNKGLPLYLDIARKKRRDFYEYASMGEEQARRSKDRIFSVENAIKAVSGEYEGLCDAQLLKAKKQTEIALKKLVVKSKDKKVLAAKKSWDKIAAAQKAFESKRKQVSYRRFDASKIAGLATQIVRYVVEVEKPNEKRFEEYRESNLESLKLRLFSPAPMYPDMEEFLMVKTLEDALEHLGPKDEFVKAALGGKNPKQVVSALIQGTTLFDVEARKQLINSGVKGVASSSDPLIVWARKLDPIYRAGRKWYEDKIEAVLIAEGKRIAQARFALEGKTNYPDATFTLRMSYGKVAGYEALTTKVAPFTTFYGLYDRALGHNENPPYNLAPRLKAAREKINLSTKVNFVTTNDIIGGNSGSPVINKNGEYVGLIFDGNIPSLVGRYVYDNRSNRSVAVHSSGILEALRSIYEMGNIIDELSPSRY